VTSLFRLVYTILLVSNALQIVYFAIKFRKVAPNATLGFIYKITFVSNAIKIVSVVLNFLVKDVILVTHQMALFAKK
jgi:hypothetical protein